VQTSEQNLLKITFDQIYSFEEKVWTFNGTTCEHRWDLRVEALRSTFISQGGMIYAILAIGVLGFVV